jgi:hypothetical protein
LLCDSDLLLAQALLQVTSITDQDEVCRVLVNLYESLDSSLTTTLLRHAIRAEIAKTESVASLFRRNSVATKLITAYTKVVGSQYLAQTLCPPLRQLLNKPRNYELDPGKLLPGESREVNLKHVVEASTLFLNAIKESLNSCPAQLHELCSFIAQEVRLRFDEKKSNVSESSSPSSSAEDLPALATSATASSAGSTNIADTVDLSHSSPAPSTLSPRGTFGTLRPKRTAESGAVDTKKLGSSAGSSDSTATATSPASTAISSSTLKYTQRVSIGGVMFLRYFCPAIVAPRCTQLNTHTHTHTHLI